MNDWGWGEWVVAIIGFSIFILALGNGRPRGGNP